MTDLSKITPEWVRSRKDAAQKIAALTAYDFPTARLLDEAGIPILLVGDSLAMVVLGYADTTSLRLEEFLPHLAAVARAKPRALVIADFPSGTYRTPAEALVTGKALVQAGAEAVKLEGGVEASDAIRTLVGAGIAVMAHIGLLPQSAGRRFRKVGRQSEERERILADARAVEEAGAFSVVVEAADAGLTAEITRCLRIPTIGIGSGSACDGQILVFHDLVGLFPWFRPRFAEPKADLAPLIREAARLFLAETQGKASPAPQRDSRL
ncbi:3-methyl-2-oxobutanoate hydroxymethyltransferase [Methylacidimicrobium tartarophylax]|uniref:3-methyl-2-oxobutanoate hydroxymethyltransferase n=1 Tax=Methylacidimicrobium tartarophylax TaxID=1041768 RepID=A0A5E6M9L1_9BACT|nr:3-methyl-2-oxobutanoate hydroxymethyltransferase [Methylacidimicrobium tartarophylax]VVM05907.1 3-methyl-2-oxobutanoate hydroxymethyltransferase [Methylacidimicrobium tartarophylax]